MVYSMIIILQWRVCYINVIENEKTIFFYESKLKKFIRIKYEIIVETDCKI